MKINSEFIIGEVTNEADNYWPDEELVDRLIKEGTNEDKSLPNTRHRGNEESVKSLVEGLVKSLIEE